MIRAYLLASTMTHDGIERFLADRKLSWIQREQPSDEEKVVEIAGRVCYMSFGEMQFRQTNSDYIANLIRQGHDSVLEHAGFTLLFDGLSRSLTHQIVRHRIGFSYSQLSQQYYEESDAEFVEPPFLKNNEKLANRWKAFMSQAQSLYREILGEEDKLKCPEDLEKRERLRLLRSFARSVLPNATSTALVVTGNARAWRYLLENRGSIVGDLEMREYCCEVYKILSAKAPNLFADFHVEEDALGSFVRREF